jgi:hypothetical protein
MKRNCIAFSLLLLLVSCKSQPGNNSKSDDIFLKEPSVAAYAKSILEISVPYGYKRVIAEPGSFTSWLRAIPLKKDKMVYLYNGKLKRNQSAQFAVIDIPVGNKDLQQCADAVIRLRAEYLFAQKKYDAIAFMDYNGKWYKWTQKSDRHAFDIYLQTVFGCCGSASLEKQLKPVSDFKAIKAGDVLVQGGFPGHAMMVVDMAVNEKGQKIFMLAQGYQPAQDMHVLVNPMDPARSSWYEFGETDDVITPEWQFKKSNLKTWK